MKDRPFTMEPWAEDVHALLKEQKIEKADLFGSSMGGGVALMQAPMPDSAAPAKAGEAPKK